MIVCTIPGGAAGGPGAGRPFGQIQSPRRKSRVKFVSALPVTVVVVTLVAASVTDEMVTVPGPFHDVSTAFGSKNSVTWNGLMWMWKGCEICGPVEGG